MFDINNKIIDIAREHAENMISMNKKEERVNIPGTPITFGVILKSGLTDSNKMNLITQEEFSTENGVIFFISR